MKKEITSAIKKSLINFPGWRTNRKIVVFESDDWGMIRMATKEAYNSLLKNGYPVDQCPVNRNDALENNKDLEQLFQVLYSVKDKFGNPAVFTANNIVANPDFNKIRDADFREYFYESFTQTLQRFNDRDNVLKLYHEGIDGKVFWPQFHGREHLNVNRWMKGLQLNQKHLHDAFKWNMYTVTTKGVSYCRRDNLDAFGDQGQESYKALESILKSGAELFRSIWGFTSRSFIAPCYIWPVEIEKMLFREGIRYIQGTHVQNLPAPVKVKRMKRKYRWTGQRNKFGQMDLMRNVQFEPALKPLSDTVVTALSEIEIAFACKKPAIVTSHRFNYTGSIHSQNRSDNLIKLKALLEKIVKKWPDVEFMTSDELGNLILKS